MPAALGLNPADDVAAGRHVKAVEKHCNLQIGYFGHMSVECAIHKRPYPARCDRRRLLKSKRTLVMECPLLEIWQDSSHRSSLSRSPTRVRLPATGDATRTFQDSSQANRTELPLSVSNSACESPLSCGRLVAFAFNESGETGKQAPSCNLPPRDILVCFDEPARERE